MQEKITHGWLRHRFYWNVTGATDRSTADGDFSVKRCADGDISIHLYAGLYMAFKPSDWAHINELINSLMRSEVTTTN